MGDNGTSSPPRPGRALTLLVVFFLVGGFAGAAVDRAYMTRLSVRRAALQDSLNRVAAATERRGGRVDIDKIPVPLEALGLSDVEREGVKNIAVRWRTHAGEIVAQMRAQTAGLENGMFAEMLCVLTPAQREQYRRSLQENGFTTDIIDKRFALVRSGGCARSSH